MADSSLDYHYSLSSSNWRQQSVKLFSFFIPKSLINVLTFTVKIHLSKACPIFWRFYRDFWAYFLKQNPLILCHDSSAEKLLSCSSAELIVLDASLPLQHVSVWHIHLMLNLKGNFCTLSRHCSCISYMQEKREHILLF